MAIFARLLYIRIQSQLVDLLLKALSAHQFHLLLSKMNTINIHSPIHLEGECKGSEKKLNKDKEDRSGVKKKRLKNKEVEKENKAKLQSTEKKAEE